MADFSKFAPLLLKLEGGFTSNPKDKGGATNMGVTLKTYREFYGMDKNVDDLRNMTSGEWKHIMKTGYWDRCKADKILSQPVAEIMVDWCVNSGSTGIRKVQEILSLKPDGIVGPLTLAAVNGHRPQELFDRIKAARKQFYIDIVKRNPAQKVFLDGWMNRLDNFVFSE